jgi:signal transduction histidine kinase
LSFSNPRKVLFRYWLEGRDRRWQDVGTRRQAIYTDLEPGHYRFHVLACNNDGIWNETGSTLEFEIQAAFYQTWWFLALCILTAALSIALVFRQRVRQLQAAMRIRMEDRIAERERIARELHDTFLQSVQGLLLKLQAALYSIPATEPARVRMEDALQSATGVLSEGRDRVWQLREPQRQHIDLLRIIEASGKELAAAYGGEFLSHFDPPMPSMPNAVAEELAAICKEALINAFQHGRPSRVSVHLRRWRRGLRLQITDDGRGFDPDTAYSIGDRHFGVSGMRERALKIRATLSIQSRPGAGCSLELSLPSWPREAATPE